MRKLLPAPPTTMLLLFEAATVVPLPDGADITIIVSGIGLDDKPWRRVVSSSPNAATVMRAYLDECGDAELRTIDSALGPFDDEERS